MSYQNPRIAEVANVLEERFNTLDVKADILKSVELKALYAEIPTLPAEQRASFGAELNRLKQQLLLLVDSHQAAAAALPALDVTAPLDINAALPPVMSAVEGSSHPISTEISRVTGIFGRMGFEVAESREIDDQYHMFESLNFPKGHPARDDWDTFMTVQTDGDGEPLIAPAHTSTMQNRLLAAGRDKLSDGEAIAYVVPDRVFRNEDLDARHEHTFYQVEGIYVAKGVNAGMLVATLQTFLQEYYADKLGGDELEVRVNPFYFPFTEPSFEFALGCPFCNKQGCSICSHEGWIELLGCGMIHPRVLTEAGIDPLEYTGFAFGCGIDRLVMMKYGIEDIRHFQSGKLEFLRQFA